MSEAGSAVAPRSGRVVLVTGSSSGIGTVLARRFGSIDASVLVDSPRSVDTKIEHWVVLDRGFGLVR